MASKAARFGNKLYVNNLPWTVAHRQLIEYFSQFGPVSGGIVVFDKSTGMSKGYGFLTFSSEKSVAAVQNKPLHMLEGHTLRISKMDPHNQMD